MSTGVFTTLAPSNGASHLRSEFRRSESLASKDTFSRIDRCKHRARLAEQRLDLAEHEESIRRERGVKGREQLFLRLPIEVDEDVATDDEIEATAFDGRRLTQQVAA